MARQYTPAERQAISRRMKAAWKRRKAQPATITPTNGLVTIDTHLVLRLHDQDITLTLGEARQLREALVSALSAPTQD